MAAFDKLTLIEQLKQLGWQQVEGEPFNMKPPEDLWENRPADFYIFDARELQWLLGRQILDNTDYIELDDETGNEST